MTSSKASRRIANIIEYEPSWFAESGSALGIFLWSMFAMTTDDYKVTGMAWLMPAVGLLFGPLRLMALFQTTPMFRVACAMAGVIGWGWLYATLFASKGLIPGLAGYFVLGYMDMLTVARFSLIARRERHEPE